MDTKNNNFNEKRKEIRIPATKLPNELKNLLISFNEEAEEIKVQTIDASPSGISFCIDIPAQKITNYNLIIRAYDKSFTLQDELVYAKPLDANTTRISVHFSKQDDLEKYQNMLKTNQAS